MLQPEIFKLGQQLFLVCDLGTLNSLEDISILLVNVGRCNVGNDMQDKVRHLSISCKV